MGAMRSQAGIKANFPNAEIERSTNCTSSNSPTRPSTRCGREEATEQLPDQGPALHLPRKQRRIDLTQEEKEALSRLEAQNLRTRSRRCDPHEQRATAVHDGRRCRQTSSSYRWNAWVQSTSRPDEALAKTIMARRRASTDRSPAGLSNGVEADATATCTAAKRKTKGYRNKIEICKASVYLDRRRAIVTAPIRTHLK